MFYAVRYDNKRLTPARGFPLPFVDAVRFNDLATLEAFVSKRGNEDWCETSPAYLPFLADLPFKASNGRGISRVSHVL